jgi:hypothetical protein
MLLPPYTYMPRPLTHTSTKGVDPAPLTGAPPRVGAPGCERERAHHLWKPRARPAAPRPGAALSGARAGRGAQVKKSGRPGLAALRVRPSACAAAAPGGGAGWQAPLRVRSAARPLLPSDQVPLYPPYLCCTHRSVEQRAHYRSPRVDTSHTGARSPRGVAVRPGRPGPLHNTGCRACTFLNFDRGPFKGRVGEAGGRGFPIGAPPEAEQTDSWGTGGKIYEAVTRLRGAHQGRDEVLTSAPARLWRFRCATISGCRPCVVVVLMRADSTVVVPLWSRAACRLVCAAACGVCSTRLGTPFSAGRAGRPPTGGSPRAALAKHC